MTEKTKQNLLVALIGMSIGMINAVLGAGGGMLAVPLLKKLNFTQKEAHTNAIAVILPITVISALIYLYKGYVTLDNTYVYIPTGIAGAFLGTWIFKKISPMLLKKVFGFLMVYAGIRLLIK